MMKTFNCGVGLYYCSKKNVKKIKNNFSKKYIPYEIGYISKNNKRVNIIKNLRW